MERWKDIKGFEGYYQISSSGRVKSVRRRIKTERSFRNIDERLRTLVEVHGYLYCELWKENDHKRYAVHRLVAEAFLDNPDSLPQVNHKDGDKKNNNVTNLEWCTQSDNNYHSYKTGLKAPYDRNGENNPMFGRHHNDSAKAKIAEVHKGMKHTDETKAKMSAAKKGVRFTDDHKAKIADSLSKAKTGTRKMTNGEINKFVHPDKISEYLQNGWTFTKP